MKLNTLLSDLRIKKGVSLKEVELSTGLSASYVHRLETGSRKNPSLPILKVLATYYNISLLELISDNAFVTSGDIFNDEKACLYLTDFINYIINKKLSEI